MALFESGTRFDQENYFRLSVDTESANASIIGELEGEPVNFSTKQIRTLTGLKTTEVGSFAIENVEAEPEAIILMAAQTYTMASGKKILCYNSIAATVLIGNGTTSVVPLADASSGTDRISYEYEDGTLTITINDSSTLGQFITNANYSLAYIY